MFIQLKQAWMGRPVGERLDVDEDLAKHLAGKGIAEILPADHPINDLIARTLTHAQERWSASMSEAIETALKQFATAQAQAKKHAIPAIFGTDGERGYVSAPRSTRGAYATPLAMDTNPKHCFGDWLLAVKRQDDAYLEKEYGSLRAKAALAEASGTTGGYIVPPEFCNQLLAVIEELAVIRPRAFVQPMASATLMFPYLDVTTVQAAGTSPFFGGVIMNWTEEAQSRTETEPAFKQMELKAHELSGYAVSSNVLLQDAAFGLEKFLMTLFSRAIAWYEDFAFLQGNGVGKPLGILNAKAALACGGHSGYATRDTAGLVKYDDVAVMFSRLLPSSQQNAIWACHPYVLQQLVQLSDSAGRLVWVANNSGAQQRVPGYLFGLPVLTTEKLPTLGTKGDLMLIDPSHYVIGDRMQIEIAASEHVNFLKNQMTWRVVERVDGQPWVDNVITLQDGASTVSPFVVLN